MIKNIRHEKQWIVFITVFIGIIAIFLIGFVYTKPAYARGSIKISSNNEMLDIKFVSASTNDPDTNIDPGQTQHIGQCTATLQDNLVDFKVFNGYPGYQCTLSASFKNMTDQVIHLQRVAANFPEELAISQPNLPSGLLLQPGDEVTLSFNLQIRENAGERAKYQFSIELIFEASGE
jgi:hypothetical protein